MSKGKEAMITDAIRQLKVNAITNAVMVSATFCTIVDSRSAKALRTRVASAAKAAVNEPVLFSSKSNQPTSLERIARYEVKCTLVYSAKSELNFVVQRICNVMNVPSMKRMEVPENIDKRTRAVRFSPIKV